MKITPIYINNGFIFIKINPMIYLISKNLKQYITSQIKNGNFYISNSDKLYLNYTLTNSSHDNKRYLSLDIKLNNTNF